MDHFTTFGGTVVFLMSLGHWCILNTPTTPNGWVEEVQIVYGSIEPLLKGSKIWYHRMFQYSLLLCNIKHPVLLSVRLPSPKNNLKLPLSQSTAHSIESVTIKWSAGCYDGPSVHPVLPLPIPKPFWNSLKKICFVWCPSDLIIASDVPMLFFHVF